MTEPTDTYRYVVQGKWVEIDPSRPVADLLTRAGIHNWERVVYWSGGDVHAVAAADPLVMVPDEAYVFVLPADAEAVALVAEHSNEPHPRPMRDDH